LFPLYLGEFSDNGNQSLQTTQKHLTAYLELIFAAVVWGISFIATKVAVADVPPAVVVWLRFTIGLIILFVFMLFRGMLRLPTFKDGLYFALLGFIGISFHQWLQSTGLVTSQASTTSWIVSTAPIFIALLAWVFLREKLGRLALLGIGLATLGVLLVVSKGNFSSLFTGSMGTPGDLLVLISAPNWAVFSVLSRSALNKFPALFVLFYVMLFGWMFSSIHFLSIQGWTFLPQISSSGWLAVGFLGIGCTALAYIFWYDGLQAITATQAGVFLYIEPLVSLVAAALILGETITLPALLGGSFILLGVWLVNRQ
jgi:drug/metabolite transporter (DMT)-like permease